MRITCIRYTDYIYILHCLIFCKWRKGLEFWRRLFIVFFVARQHTSRGWRKIKTLDKTSLNFTNNHTQTTQKKYNEPFSWGPNTHTLTHTHQTYKMVRIRRARDTFIYASRVICCVERDATAKPKFPATPTTTTTCSLICLFFYKNPILMIVNFSLAFVCINGTKPIFHRHLYISANVAERKRTTRQFLSSHLAAAPPKTTAPRVCFARVEWITYMCVRAVWDKDIHHARTRVNLYI